MRVSKLKIGFMSMLSFGSIGSREGAWHWANEIFTKENVDLTFLVGGLISNKDLKKKLSKATKGMKMIDRVAYESRQEAKWIRYLAKRLPVMNGNKTHILTSSTDEQDGELGRRIAEALAMLRKDITLLDQDNKDGCHREPLYKLNNLNLGLFTPTRAGLGTLYASTKPDGVLLEAKRKNVLGDLNVVGCFANFLMNTGATNKIGKPRIILPALCKINKVKYSDRSTGVVVLNFWYDTVTKKDGFTATVYDLKELLDREMQSVKSPEDFSALQKKIVKTLIKQGPRSLSALENSLEGYERSDMQQALQGLLAKKSHSSWPGLKYNEASTKYFFDRSWFQRSLRYRILKRIRKTAKTIRRIDTCCPHVGCVFTDMRGIVEDVPREILEQDAKYLICSGDIIEGLAHNISNDGSVYFGSYTEQEACAAFVFSKVIMKVFDERMKSKNLQCLSLDELYDLIKDNLVTFLFIPGNHDEWQYKNQNNPLAIFARDLQDNLLVGINKFFKSKGVLLSGDTDILRSIVQERMVLLGINRPYQLSSGLNNSLLHPHLGNTQTASIRAEGALDQASTSHVVDMGNFHTKELMTVWERGLGMRVVVQIGTFKKESPFEERKGKIGLDTGFIATEITSMTFDKGQMPRIVKASFTILSLDRSLEEIQLANLNIIDEFRTHQNTQPNFWLRKKPDRSQSKGKRKRKK